MTNDIQLNMGDHFLNNNTGEDIGITKLTDTLVSITNLVNGSDTTLTKITFIELIVQGHIRRKGECAIKKGRLVETLKKALLITGGVDYNSKYDSDAIEIKKLHANKVEYFHVLTGELVTKENNDFIAMLEEKKYTPLFNDKHGFST